MTYSLRGRTEHKLRQQLPAGFDCAVLHVEDRPELELRAWPNGVFDVMCLRRVWLPYALATIEQEADVAISSLVAMLKSYAAERTDAT